MDRRDFLRTGLALGGATLATTTGCATADAAATPSPAPQATATPPAPGSWEAFRAGFELDHDDIHLSHFLLAPHHRSVREAIELYREALDVNPVRALKQYSSAAEAEVSRAAAAYLGVKPEELALTDSTTMGLGLVYSGLRLREGEEILTSTQEHYSTDQSLTLRAERTGASVRRVSFYTDPERLTEEAAVQGMLQALTPRTRYVAVTWVYSVSGVKYPVRALADALAKVNAGRSEDERILLCVDGVHGLGAEAETIPQLGCDFFISGCHKWMFGPRGTGFIWGKPSAWQRLVPTIPTFYSPAVRVWAKDDPPGALPPGPLVTPGGFHSFEHRWALNKAFELHQRLGRERVTARVHELNRHLKEELGKMPHVRVRTPMSDSLSAGITCFEVPALKPSEVVKRLEEKRIITTVSHYVTRYVRAAPGLLNSPEDVEALLREVRAMA
ncbi:aminotransferase class V-fold PLP-dependent enzyme [Archangium sp.]|uniref:aminotransferase class V-fold PLP-dependent enzyme n=1 Tax=Archangium sp. TaxID=1872627 RepID=UPI00389B138F